jgi:hypothetical protein
MNVLFLEKIITANKNDEQGWYNNTDDKYEIPEIADLNSGWTGDKFGIPPLTCTGSKHLPTYKER